MEKKKSRQLRQRERGWPNDRAGKGEQGEREKCKEMKHD